jgi:hypothetical protein
MLTVFLYAHYLYDAFMLQVHDQMMNDMFLRPLPLLFGVFWVFFGQLLSLYLGSSNCYALADDEIVDYNKYLE